MSNVCTDQHKFHTSHQLVSPKKFIRDVDNIPPRKLLTRRAIHEISDMYSDSPRFSSAEETLLQKFLPYNNCHDSDDDSDPYSSDHFRMYEFKVRRCTRSRSHDWTDCPFAHPGEKARRRDTRRYNYSGTICPEYCRGGCSRGDSCEFAHGVFECWLHPDRYRTEACKDGKNCKRKVCFFAHTPRQLRILPVNSQNSSADHISCKKSKFLNLTSVSNNCCLFCHCCAATSSPTSTLLGMSHLSPPLSPSSSISPPLSPVKRRTVTGFAPISSYSDRFGGLESSSGMNPGAVSYKDVLTELMSSLEASPVSVSRTPNLPWVCVSFDCEDQQQFILSPSSLIPASVSSSFFSGNENYVGSKSFSDENRVNDNGWSCPALDLGWVNELLM
ncbi:Zinc finger CCCH domain-containing protein [Quillaja saponaria]|uniref:Zinc finger CCCH domain-containing protein n=1 Tax=Quillaja saponaria TaxID=32244 RepID=A0AAD7VMI3_QUISA|nr:Zinc finger CCCH domain-containing protein [Quillaja saponaria]